MSIARDTNGGGIVRQTESQATGPDGTVTLTDRNADGTMIYRTVKTSSASDGTIVSRTIAMTDPNGLSSSTRTDATGDGTFDHIVDTDTVLNADGTFVAGVMMSCSPGLSRVIAT